MKKKRKRKKKKHARVLHMRPSSTEVADQASSRGIRSPFSVHDPIADAMHTIRPIVTGKRRQRFVRRHNASLESRVLLQSTQCQKQNGVNSSIRAGMHRSTFQIPIAEKQKRDTFEMTTTPRGENATRNVRVGHTHCKPREEGGVESYRFSKEARKGAK